MHLVDVVDFIELVGLVVDLIDSMDFVDLIDLVDLQEGSSFKFFGNSYQIKDGEIILVKSEST